MVHCYHTIFFLLPSIMSNEFRKKLDRKRKREEREQAELLESICQSNFSLIRLYIAFSFFCCLCNVGAKTSILHVKIGWNDRKSSLHSLFALKSSRRVIVDFLYALKQCKVEIVNIESSRKRRHFWNLKWVWQEVLELSMFASLPPCTRWKYHLGRA